MKKQYRVPTFVLVLLIIVLAVLYVIISPFRENFPPQKSESTVESVLPEPDRSNIYGGGSIELRDPDGHIVSPTSPSPDSSEGIIDTNNTLRTATDYRLQYEFPDRLKAQIENGDTRFFVKCYYSFQVAQGNSVRLYLEVHDLDSHEIYTYSASVPTTDDLCLKHAISTQFYPTPDFGKDALEISLSTSAHPDAGPKSTQDKYYSTFECRYLIKGIEDWGEIESQLLTDTTHPNLGKNPV